MSEVEANILVAVALGVATAQILAAVIVALFFYFTHRQYEERRPARKEGTNCATWVDRVGSGRRNSDARSDGVRPCNLGHGRSNRS
jgi:hypothetical protein